MNKEKILKAGKIASKVKEYAKSITKPNMPLLELAGKIEDKIKELGGQPAFPTNLSINEIAAHYTPSHNDETKATGLLKIDFGVHIDGELADTAFSIDLKNSDQNKKLIQSAEQALENAIKEFKSGITTSQIGKTIQETIESQDQNPITNLSGHSMENYDLHAGITIPNIDDKKNIILDKGLYAIEPFTTSGNGKVHDGKPSGIYCLIETKNTRSPIARQILKFIKEKYQTLPFCSRWLVKELGRKALIGLKQLEQQEILHQFPQLIEDSKSKVAQAEDTTLIEENGDVVVTTR